MITQIGIVAGEILNYLDKNGMVKMEEICRKIKKPRELVLMSLGWLARENHILVEKKENIFFLTSKKKTEKI